jgi:hypothetical protein
MIWAVTTQPMANAMVTTQISNHIGGPSLGLPPPNAYEQGWVSSNPTTVIFKSGQ